MTPTAPPPMILRGRDGSLSLSIVRYQFPDISTGDYDANWLLIDGRVTLGDRSWTFRDPAATTVEMRNLADWFEGLAGGEPVEDWCGFIEPNLEFDRTSATKIRAAFAAESAPPWARDGDDWTAHGLDVLIDDQLNTAARSLREQLKIFPPRGDWAA